MARAGGPAVQLYHEDCVAGMRRRLTPGSVDVVVTSPPYNIGVQYRTYDDNGSRDDYLEWMGRWAEALFEVLADNGSLFLVLGAKPTDPWVPFLVAMVVGKYLALQNVIHWVKSIAIEKKDVGDYPGIVSDVAIGHLKPINSPRFLSDCHEYVFHFTKTGEVELDRLAVGVPYQDKSNVTRWKRAAADRRCRGNVWFVPYKTIKSRAGQRPHPATFPTELARKCILLHGRERARLVLDPFLGIGHAGAAAVSLGLDFVGFEIDGDYLETARAVICERAAGK